MSGLRNHYDNEESGKGEGEALSRSPVEAGRFYLRYLNATGCLPLGGIWRSKKKITFTWISPKVAYTLGVILFIALQGYVRITASLKQISAANGRLQTDQLVMASMTISSPAVAVINMTALMFKAQQLKTFLEKFGEQRSKSSYFKQRCVIILFMIMFCGCVAQTLSPGVHHVVANVSLQDLSMQVADGLFWVLSIPAITAPSCLYYFITSCLANSFSDVANASKQRATELHPSSKDDGLAWDGRKKTGIRELIDKYNAIKNMLQEANQVFSPLLLWTLVYFGVELCMFLYDAMITFLFQDNLIIGLGIEIMYATFFLLLILAVTEGAQDIENQSERCIECLGEIPGEAMTEEERACMKTFYPVALAKPPNCHASNFFTINRRFLVAVLSATLTYIIILVQFKKSETNTRMTLKQTSTRLRFMNNFTNN